MTGATIPAEALPQQIGRLMLGEKRSDGERLCSHCHDVPVGHPLYCPERMGEYPDDIDPLCLAHAIEQAVDDNGWCEKCSADDLADQPSPPVGDGGQPFAYFQWNDGWKMWEQVASEFANEPGVIAGYRAALSSPTSVREAQLEAERAFLLARLTEREYGAKRWTGSSSDDLVALAFGVRHSVCLPGDQNDLSACYLTLLRMPSHLITADVIAQLRCAEATVGETAWARENAKWPGTDAFAALAQGGEVEA